METVRPGPGELLEIAGAESFLLVRQSGSRFPLCIETFSGEYCQAVEAGDLVAVSAPEGGSRRAAAMLLELIRVYHTPLVVLPRSHPGSRRLRYVVSAGGCISLSCTIERGTHPEQHLLCSSGELAGISLEGTAGGILVTGIPGGVSLSLVPVSAFLESSGIEGIAEPAGSFLRRGKQ